MTDKLVERLTPDFLKEEGVKHAPIHKGTAGEEIQKLFEETFDK